MGTDSSSGLPPLPPTFAATRLGLHRVAEAIVAPARKPDNEISLRATPGGFGTPEFEHEGVVRRVRTDGTELVYERGGGESRAPLATLASAAELVADLLPAGAKLDSHPLEIDAASAEALASWFDLGRRVLGALADEAPERDEATIPLLWPEHFDIAIESGSEAGGTRANYGFSPGDDDHAEPYAYVGPWTEQATSEIWNAKGFPGAELGYAELAGTDDPVAAALEFCRTRREALD